MPSRAASSGSDTISSATPSTASTSSRVSSDSTTSWRVMYVEMVAWMIAAAGNAMNAPSRPEIEPPASAGKNATAGCSAMVRAVILGASR